MKAETWEEFQALPEAVREDVLEKRRTWNVGDSHWYQHLFAGFTQEMAELGIEVGEIYFSGFWSQGDGACFNGRLNNQEKFFAQSEMAKYAILGEEGPLNLDVAKWVSSGRYCHEHTLSFDFSYDDTEPEESEYESPLRYQIARISYDETEKLISGFEGDFEEWIKGKCRDLYSTLEKEYEYQTSDEQIVESLIANECLNEAIKQACEALGIEEPEVEDEHV